MPTPSSPRFPRATCVGYCRVSTAEQAQHGWSIEQQEDSIRAWAAAQGLEVVAVFRDAGRSGRTMQRRSGLLGLLELVHQGGIGVVVAKAQDRLARAVDHAIGLRHWLHRHGTDLLLLDGDIHLRAADVGGAMNLGADFLASLTAVLAEEEVATLRRRIIPNIAQAARCGRRGGRLSLGYRRQPDGGIAVEPHDADLIRRAVEAVRGGSGLSQLSRLWVAQAVRDSQGDVVSFDRLRGALRNPFLTGDLHYRLPVEAVGEDGAQEVCIPAHHPALIDRVTFALVQTLLQARSRTPAAAMPSRCERRRTQRRSQRLPAGGDLLAVLRPATKPVHGAIPPEALRCGVCGGPMYASAMTVGGPGKRSTRATYLCRYHKDRGVAFCAQPPVEAERVDAVVGATVCSHLRTLSLGDATDAAPDGQGAASPQADLAAHEARRDRLAASLRQLGDLAPPALRDRLATTEAEIVRLTACVQRAASSPQEPTGPSWAFRRRPQATWDALDTAGRRTALAPLLASVVLRGKAVASVALWGADGLTSAVPVIGQERS